MADNCKLWFILILVVVWQFQITQQKSSMPNSVSTNNNNGIKINGEFIIQEQYQQQKSHHHQHHHHQLTTTRNSHQTNHYNNCSNVETNSNDGGRNCCSTCKHKRHWNNNTSIHMRKKNSLFNSNDDISVTSDNPNNINDFYSVSSDARFSKSTDLLYNRHQKRHRHRHYNYRHFNMDFPEASYRSMEFSPSMLASTSRLKHNRLFIDNEQELIGNKLVPRDESILHWPVKKEAIMEGDLVLGGLMMVHSREDTIMCGPIMPQGGIQALEAMLYTLDRINRDGLLPNITIGAHILDDCDRDSYGLEMAVDFIKGE